MTVEVGVLKDHLITPLPQGRCGPCSTTPGPHRVEKWTFLVWQPCSKPHPRCDVYSNHQSGKSLLGAEGRVCKE